MAAPSPADDTDGRRHRGLVLAVIVLVIGVPATTYAWLSDRNVDREATDVAEDLRVAGRLVDDVDNLWDLESGSLQDDAVMRPLGRALGYGDRFAGAVFDEGAISAAYEVRWGLATRCVHLLLRDDEVRTDVTDSTSCAPRVLSTSP